MKRELQRPEVLAGVAWGALAAFVLLETFYGAAAVGLTGGAGAALLAQRADTLSWKRSLNLGTATGFFGGVVVLVLGTLVLSLLAPDQIEKFSTPSVQFTGDLLLHVWFVTLLLGLFGGVLAVIGSFAAWGGTKAWQHYQAYQAAAAAAKVGSNSPEGEQTTPPST